MGQKPADDRKQPSLELPPLIALLRRRTRPAEPANGRTLPRLPGRAAAALTGLVVGAAGTGATYAAMLGCEAVRGTSTCGGGPGFVLLVAIVALMVLLGAGILTALSVDEPTSTAVLAVGLVVVVVMLFLLGAVFSAWMFAAVPALGAVAFLLAHWVTTRFDDVDGGA